jgi:GTP-binding protein HflX
MAHFPLLPTKIPVKTLIIGVDAPYNRVSNIESYFAEFRKLLETNGTVYQHELYIKMRTIDSSYFFTKGKLEEIAAFCKEHKIEEVVVSDPLTSQQERNLEDMLQGKVFDRTYLILEIFEKSAHSAEGKLQVAIAMLKYQNTRLAGKGIFMEQQVGSIGVRGGFGETLKEKETRHIDTTILKYKRDLERMHTARASQRKQRLANRIPHVCLIGYTNVGKSTILNVLTKSDVLAENKLFATLDTTTRELYINGVKKGLLSDTVGFIQQLPHNLIDAFKSTLSELNYADLLLHVVDISNPNWQDQIAVVQKVLVELKVQDKLTLYVFNKADAIEITPDLPVLLKKYQPHVLISAKSKKGLEPLMLYLETWHPRKA